MKRSGHVQTRWLMVALLAGAGATLWEIGADAGRVRVVVRFLAGQRVSLGSAGASDNYVLITYLAEVIALGAGLVLFLAWRRRPHGRPSPIRPVIAVWWALWIGANIVGRLVELTYRATSSLTDIRNVTLLDIADSVGVTLSLLVMVTVVRRAEQRSTARRAVPSSARARAPKRDSPTPVLAEVPAPALSHRRRRAATALAVAALVVVPLALGFVVSNGTMKVSRPSSTPAAAASAAWQASNATSTTCADAMFKPSGALAAGLTSSCADLTLGASLFSADCANGALPAGLSPEIFDDSGQTSDLGTVTAAAAGCDLTTKSTSVTAAVLAGDASGPANEPGSVVVVADFIPANNASGLNTVGVRVSSSEEFDVAVQSGGQYAVIQSTGGSTPEALLQGSFSNDQAGAPDLSKEVRIVVSVKGTTAAAYVDGLLIGAGPTAVPDEPGGCGFSLSTNDATHPVVATLVRLEIFAAG
jgi:hypothetical protein